MAVQLGGGHDNVIENNFFISDDCAIWVDDRGPNYNWDNNRKTLQEVPYRSPLWQAKYPALAKPMMHDNWPEGNVIRHNIIISSRSDGIGLRYTLPTQGNELADNLVWGTKAKFTMTYDFVDHLNDRAAVSWQDWLHLGVEKNSLEADPCASLSGNTLKFCADSPVNKMGFKILPDDIGLI
jgi:hypothetical protein